MECPHSKWNGHICPKDKRHWCLKKERPVTYRYNYQYCLNDNYKECVIYQKELDRDCFFTTILCEILGQEKENNPILNNLCYFRINVLEQSEYYKELLVCHERISPLIARAIRHTSKDLEKEFIELIYTSYLLPLNKFIIENDIDNAIQRYKQMRNLLIVNFSLGQEWANITSYYKKPELYRPKVRRKIIPIGFKK